MASRRGYLTTDELEEYADITVTNEDEAYDQISQAEEIIDAYVGPQQKALHLIYEGEVSSVSGLTVFDTGSGTSLGLTDDYFKGAEIEIIGGTGIGQRRIIASSSKDNKSVTVSEAFTTAPDTTSVFRIYQLGKFPRSVDIHTNRSGTKYYRYIPEAVRRAVAAQVEFMMARGTDFFTGDPDMEAETFLNYSYRRQQGATAGTLDKIVAPKAKALLRGIMNRKGQMLLGDRYVRKYPV